MPELSNALMRLNPTLESLIRELADGEWHSGEGLGESLGVSRAAVSKQLRQLEGLGLVLERVKGKGYRLAEPLDLFDEDMLKTLLPKAASSQITRFHLHAVTSSTNSFLMQRMRAGKRVHGEICLAEQQSAGRGRRGRAWFSPFGQNLYLSIAWHFESGVSAIEGLSLAVGVAVCKALEALDIHSVRLKWPNDILVVAPDDHSEHGLVDRKLGGILIELGGDAVSDCIAIVGLGLNINMKGAATEDVDQPWVSLSQLGLHVSRNAVATNIIGELIDLLASYESRGFISYYEAWNRLNAFAGERVSLTSAQNTAEGVMQGVDNTGALQLELASGETQSYIGGELSLRKLS